MASFSEQRIQKMQTARSSELSVTVNQTTRRKHPEDKTKNLGHCQHLVLQRVKRKKKKKTYKMTSSTHLPVCEVIPATKPSRIFTIFVQHSLQKVIEQACRRNWMKTRTVLYLRILYPAFRISRPISLRLGTEHLQYGMSLNS
jgi:hypothetical protein